MTQTFDQWMDRTAVDADGEKIGKITDIYLDDQTGEPEWLAIKTGMFGGKLSFAPMADARMDGDDVRIAYAKDVVKDAPKVEEDGHLEPEEEAELYRHYGRQYESAAPAAPQGEMPKGGGEAMSRKEEELQVGTLSQEAGRVRLRKYVVTENVSTTVPVEKEVARLVREDVDPKDARRGGAVGEDGEVLDEVVLRQEEVVVDKEVVEKERVSLGVDKVTEQREVNEQVRKERVEVEGDIDDDTTR